MKWFWLILAIFLGIGEILTVEFFLLWFCVGAIGAAITAYFYPFVYQLLVFVLLSLILVIYSRKVILGKNETKTNVEALVGKNVLVIETIQKIYCDRGLVKVNGEIWRAYTEGEDIPVGTMVTITEVSGTKLKVIREAEE